MLKIRRPLGRLIFNMGIAIPGKTVFLIETAPWRICAVQRGLPVCLPEQQSLPQRDRHTWPVKNHSIHNATIDMDELSDISFVIQNVATFH